MMNTGNEELVYLHALNMLSVLGPVRINLLLEFFKTARAAWEATEKELSCMPGLTKVAGRLVRERAAIRPDLEWEKLSARQIKAVSRRCSAYPGLLRHLHQPPPLLYFRGLSPGSFQIAVAIVGSRRCTFYGKEVASRLAQELAAAMITVVSGMALGIDSAAHRGALQAGGTTVAVLGCGLDYCYPPANKDLMEQIISSGAVISEFPPGTRPLPQHFPQRNRIISGMSLGTVVVEAPEKSGALITAGYALEQGREVFAVPGNVGSPYSRGSHRLLKEGAHLVEKAADIVAQLPINMLLAETGTGACTAARDLNGEEKQVLQLVPYDPVHMDDIVRLSRLDAAQVGAVLLNLELKGCLRQLPGKYFCRI